MAVERVGLGKMENFLMENYNYVMNDLGDPRVKEWTSFSTPAVPAFIIVIYWIAVFVLLPKFMENRKAYGLRTLLFYYNIFQILACVGIIYGIVTSGWTTTYNFRCQPVDYSDNPEAVRMLSYLYYTWILKGIELTETLMFVLRKKYNQVSKLHIYHHSSTFLFGWLGVKYIGGGMATFPVILNCIIHIFMYFYYLLSSLGPDWQQKVMKWKAKLTMIQMIQFCIIIGYSLQSLHQECKVPKLMLLIYVPNITLIFYMFWEFYHANYVAVRKEKKF